jgi:hypothetical protein
VAKKQKHFNLQTDKLKKKVSKERSSHNHQTHKRYTKGPQTIPQFGDTKVMNFAKRIEY